MSVGCRAGRYNRRPWITSTRNKTIATTNRICNKLPIASGETKPSTHKINKIIAIVFSINYQQSVNRRESCDKIIGHVCTLKHITQPSFFITSG
jgi:hypothetical protein